MRIKTFNRGFTLLELLVVIAIIGILASVVVISIGNARARARDTQRKSDFHQIRTALELYYNKCGTYIVRLNCVGPAYGYTDGYMVGSGGLNVHYFWIAPTPPGSISQGLVANGTLTKEITDPQGTGSGSDYVLYIPPNGKSYSLIGKLENPTAEDISKFLNTSTCPIPAVWAHNDPGTWTLWQRNYCVTN